MELIFMLRSRVAIHSLYGFILMDKEVKQLAQD